MEPSFWKARWTEGRVLGFHEGIPNDLLVTHVGVLGPPGRVLVPLCGKAEDMAFLVAQGHEVIGIELAEEAVDAFFLEHELKPVRARRGNLEAYAAKGITILQGDFFDVTQADVGQVTAVYDRAAVVALPPEMRPRYIRHLSALAGPGAVGLVISFDYPQEAMDGPPFSVPEAELRSYYAEVTPLAERPGGGPRLREAGVSAIERIYSVRGR
jgi:thiopurine S-methyltransferase